MSEQIGVGILAGFVASAIFAFVCFIVKEVYGRYQNDLNNVREELIGLRGRMLDIEGKVAAIDELNKDE